MSQTQRKQFMSVEEVANYLMVSRMTVYRLVHDEGNPLGAVTIRGTIRVPIAGLKAYLDKS